jgi:hypothetical protein
MDKSLDPEPPRSPLETLVRRLGATAMGAAAALWLWSASIDVEGNGLGAQDQLMRMAELNRYGSAAAVVAALCAMILFLLKPAPRDQ